MTKKYIIGFVLVAFVVVVFFNTDVLQKGDNTNTVQGTGVIHKIVLESEGFNPDDITIKLGDTVEFSSKNGKPYWPASNLHPSHRAYSEFDPKQPIEPEDTWSFTFDKVGEWKFHGHLAPYWVGIIRVTE